VKDIRTLRKNGIKPKTNLKIGIIAKQERAVMEHRQSMIEINFYKKR
jgi:hypothetical protein